jgi:hypothetical protein
MGYTLNKFPGAYGAVEPLRLHPELGSETLLRRRYFGGCPTGQ